MQIYDITKEQIDAWIPRRNVQADKNAFGRVWAFCGSEGYTGAPFFAAQSAVRTGSGVVMLALPKEIYPILAVKLNEPVLVPYTVQTWRMQLEQAKRADACLIGPGIGHFEEFGLLTKTAIENLSCPIILDADGINALHAHIDILSSAKQPVVLTPHAREFSRLTGISRPTVQDLVQFSLRYRCILLYKGHRTLVIAPDGTVTRNQTGNPGMAKGGSGDILSGIILSLIGQGLEPAQAARAGAYLHGKAGDICANQIGEYGMTPTDLLHMLPLVLREYNSKEW